MLQLPSTLISDGGGHGPSPASHGGKDVTHCQAPLWQVHVGTDVPPQAGTGAAVHCSSGGRSQLAPATTVGGRGHEGTVASASEPLSLAPPLLLVAFWHTAALHVSPLLQAVPLQHGWP